MTAIAPRERTLSMTDLALDAELRRLEREIDRDGSAILSREPISPSVLASARAALAQAVADCAPGRQQAAMEFFLEMSLGFPNLPSAKVLTGLHKTFWEDCAELPAGVWSLENAREARKTFEFFPSSAKVFKFLSEKANPIRRRRYLLSELVRRPPAVAASPPPTEAEKAQVHDLVSSLTRELNGRAAVRAPRQPALTPLPRRRQAQDRTALRKRYEQIAETGSPPDQELAVQALAAMDRAAQADAEASEPGRVPASRSAG